MGKLYIEELTIASAAAKGEHGWKNGEGDHIGIIKKANFPNLSTIGKKE
jgi:hypothetical protein